jgi:hypothetical protein
MMTSSEDAVEEENNDALWRLFRNAGAFSGGVCRDVVEKHVLPRLNSNDVKFLYGVNTETRKLIKRSSRKGELKKKFRVREMSSVSTLEVAWENRSLWPRWLEDETYFSEQVAYTNKLELLKWAREEKNCEWDYRTINVAVRQGNMEMFKYCVANDQYHVFSCERAAESGHLDCLKYLRETAKVPWDSWAVRRAHENNHPECLQYLLDNNCPLPDGWRYEDGELHIVA